VTVGSLGQGDLQARLRSVGLRFRVGPFVVRLRSSMLPVVRSIATLYANHPVEADAEGAHFNVRVDAPSLLRRAYRPQAQFTLDQQQPFIPLPASMAAPMLEAGLNWCIHNHAHQFIVIHSATLERHGRALLMPAPPGSGKSTLCAALVARGWRLLSDEYALIDPASGLLVPVPRPVSLKDRSIGVIADWAPDTFFGASVVNNEGQLVAYARPPAESVAAASTRCPGGLIVFPQYVESADTTVTRATRARAVLHLADSSFNYNLHGRQGFGRLADLADAAPCVTLRYSRLDEGVEAVNRLADWGPA